MHYQHHHHTTILHNNPSMLANKCKIDLYLPFNQMIPTTMQVVNHFQALIMVPYLMLQKKRSNILIQTYWQIIITKLNQGYNEIFISKQVQYRMPKTRVLTKYSQVTKFTFQGVGWGLEQGVAHHSSTSTKEVHSPRKFYFTLTSHHRTRESLSV